MLMNLENLMNPPSCILPDCFLDYSVVILNGKKPVNNGWERFCNERRTVSDIENLNGNNLGIACGPASGVIVLDVDDPDLFYDEIDKRGLSVPPTRRVKTGREDTNGTHHYYRYPNDGQIYTCRNQKKKGFDIRAVGGQVVAPGSVHPDTGIIYELIDDQEPVPAPDWLLYFSLHGKFPEQQEKKTDLSEILLSDFSGNTNAPYQWDGQIDHLPLTPRVKNYILHGLGRGSRSEAGMAVLNGLVFSNLSDDEIFQIFDTYPIGEKYREKGSGKEKWLQSEIDRARGHVPNRATERNRDSPKNESRNLDLKKVTPSEIKQDSINLNIPESIYNVAGLISDGLEAAQVAGSPDIIQYNLPIVLSIIARAIASKVCLQGIYPGIYNIKIGGTSTGKTDSDRFFKQEIARIGIEGFYGPSDFASGPGLLRAMSEDGRGQTYVAMDEVTYLFKRFGNSDQLGAGKMSTILELYTASGGTYSKAFGDKSNAIQIENPVLVLTGNATPGIFDDIRQEDMTSGLMQRFDFWAYDGPIPYRNQRQANNQAATRFFEGISRLMAAIPQPKHSHDIMSIISNYDLELSQAARKMLSEHSRHVTDAANQYGPDEEDKKGMVSRQYHLSIKYAMIHAASTRPAGSLFEPLQAENLEWGISVAEMLCRWKIDVLCGRVRQGEFHAKCENFKDAIRIATKSGKKPTIKTLCNRKRCLKALRKKDFDEIISVLADRGEIIIDADGRVPVFWLSKSS
jgi:hypothetical protein